MFIVGFAPSGAMGELLYQGKVKQVWSTDDPNVLEFRYTDQISVYDQIIPSLIPRKGESLNRTTCHWFDLVSDEGVCETHLIEMNAPDRCLARRFEVIKEQLPLALEKDEGLPIPEDELTMILSLPSQRCTSKRVFLPSSSTLSASPPNSGNSLRAAERFLNHFQEASSS